MSGGREGIGEQTGEGIEINLEWRLGSEREGKRKGDERGNIPFS